MIEPCGKSDLQSVIIELEERIAVLRDEVSRLRKAP